MPEAKPFFSTLSIGDAFLGARTQRLADLISAQGDQFIESAGITVPARSISTLLYLKDCGSASLVQIAKALDEPHQVTAKRIASLEEHNLLLIKADRNDKRRRLISLSRKGKRVSEKVESRCEDALLVFEELNRELDVKLGEVLDAAHQALSKHSMLERLSALRAFK